MNPIQEHDASDPLARIAQLEARLQRLETREDIESVYLRYMRGFDRNDTELVRSAFWEDAQINYGRQVNTLEEFLVRHLADHVKRLSAYGHLLSNPTIEVDGDVAHVEIYVTALFSHGSPESDFAGGATIASGRYVDRLDRREGEWRISVREFVGHFAARTESAYDYTKGRSYVTGSWDRKDPSYARPLVRRSVDSDTQCAL